MNIEYYEGYCAALKNIDTTLQSHIKAFTDLLNKYKEEEEKEEKENE